MGCFLNFVCPDSEKYGDCDGVGPAECATANSPDDCDIVTMKQKSIHSVCLSMFILFCQMLNIFPSLFISFQIKVSRRCGIGKSQWQMYQ